MLVGEKKWVGWNSAQRLGCGPQAVRLEQSGHDWLVLRGDDGRAHAVDFASRAEKVEFTRGLSE